MSFLPRGPEGDHLNLSETFSPPKRSLWNLVHFPQEQLLMPSGIADFSGHKGPVSAFPRAMGARMVYKSMNKENH